MKEKIKRVDHEAVLHDAHLQLGLKLGWDGGVCGVSCWSISTSHTRGLATVAVKTHELSRARDRER